MERRPDGENRITKVGEFPWETTKKLRNSKEINGNCKRNYKEAIWQKKTKPTRIERRRQHVARG